MVHTAELKPDPNRPNLESRINSDSAKLSIFPWQENRVPRILLIVPPYTRMEQSIENLFQHMNRSDEYQNIMQTFKQNNITHLKEMKRAGFPLGLLRIGTAAKEKGYEIQILDSVFEGWNQEKKYFKSENGLDVFRYGLNNQQITAKIKEFNPDIVGISIDYTHQWGNAREVANLVKQINEQTPLIMGGTHASAMYSDVLFDSPTDYVILGQGDKNFVELLDVLTKKSKKHISEIDGLAYKENNQLKIRKQTFIKDLTSIHLTDFSLIDFELYNLPYYSAGKRQHEEGNLMYGFSSTGCNTQCNFCAIPGMQGQWLNMNNDSFEEYVQKLKKQNVTEFILEDDHILHDPNWAKHVFETLGKYNLPYMCEGGISMFNLVALHSDFDKFDLIKSKRELSLLRNTINAKKNGLNTRQLIQTMKNTGAYGLYLAIESANNESMINSNKSTLNTQEKYAKEIVKMFAEANINTTLGFMLGFISNKYVESKEQIQKTIDYAKRLYSVGANYVNPFIFTPLPGAPNFNSLKKYATPNTDEGYSHEFGTMNAPNGEWTKEELTLIRAHSLIHINGIEKYKQIENTGTWPV